MTLKGKLLVGVAAVVLISGIIALTTHHAPLALGLSARKAVYYCPMHPSYTSDKPGDCPICNMRLVKRDASVESPKPASPKDICYLHNCPMARQGQPCPMLVVAKQGERVDCPICKGHVAGPAQPARETKILYWTDPMLPGYKSDKPGKSPMGMDLVPVYAEEQPATASAAPEGYAPILVTPQKQQLIGITTAPVQRRELTKTIRTAGVVAHDPELYEAQQEFIQAYRAWQQARESQVSGAAEQAQQMVESTMLRLRHLGLSDALIEAMKQQAQPDERLLVGGAGQHWIYASIYENERPLVQPGQQAVVTSSALPGKRFEGVVQAIDPMLDQATRTARARVLLEDPDQALAPGMYVDVSIGISLGQVLAVPEAAVMATGLKHLVFVDKGQGLFEPRDVVVGMKADRFFAVQSGLSEGEVVITSGNFLIDSESRLKAAQTSAGGAQPHDP